MFQGLGPLGIALGRAVFTHAQEEEERRRSLFVFMDTVEGPRAEFIRIHGYCRGTQGARC